MKLKNIIKENSDSRAGYTKTTSLSSEMSDRFVYIYRAQPLSMQTLTDGSYATRSKKFAKDHAVHSANVEDEKFHVIMAFVKTEHVFNSQNPGEYIYSGPEVKGRTIFIASPGDDFEE